MVTKKKKTSYKTTEDGVKFPAHCPYCKSTKTVVVRYRGDPDRYAECEGCYTVIGRIKGKRYFKSG